MKKQESTQKRQYTDAEKQRSVGVGMLFGISIGLCLGAATDNIALFIGAGIAIGAGIGASGVFANVTKSK